MSSNTKRKRVDDGKTVRVVDASNIAYLRTNPVIMRQCKKARTHPPIQQRIRDDFVTMYLVKWSLPSITKATGLLINILNHHDDASWYEAQFAHNTPISYVDTDGTPRTISYRLYYNQLYESAVSRCRDGVGTGEGTDHIVSLLRACFIIGFLYDVRIRRFVMASHSLHKDYLYTRPPPKEKALLFVKECSESVDAYLTFGDEDEYANILSMTSYCITTWIRLCMI